MNRRHITQVIADRGGVRLAAHAPGWAAVPLVIRFIFYAPWVWGGAWWLLRRQRR